MNIVYYVNPCFVRENPYFYEGALKNKLIRQAEQLNKKHNIYFVVNQVLADVIPSTFEPIIITQSDIFSCFGSTKNIEEELYVNKSAPEKYLELLKDKINKDIDIIIGWETPIEFMKEAFPNAITISQMPGFMSRAPFPELLINDLNGLFNNSSIIRYNHEKTHETTEGIEIINDLRTSIIPEINSISSWTRADLDPENQYDKLVLLPLQISEQYAFITDSGYRSQMSLLLDVLTSLPENIGLVVTQYVSNVAKETPITENSYLELKKLYPNLIWNKKFNSIDNISQYLLDCVDSVATISSSIGVQAALWNKPVIALSNTYINKICSYNSMNDYISGRANNNKHIDEILSWAIAYQQPLAAIFYSEDGYFEEWLTFIKENKKSPNLFKIFPNYQELVKSEYKIDNAMKQALRANSLSQLENNFNKTIREIKPALISFDIFDTLIDRVVEQPVHVFKFIERDIDILTQGKIPNYSTIRPMIERSVRESAKEIGHQEITLDEIMQELGKRYQLSLNDIEEIKEREINGELEFISLRKSGLKLLNIAEKNVEKVILISDMYLSKEVITRLLKKSGYNYDIKLYLSSEVGLRKHEGDLFNHVQRIEKIDPKRWLHVGDNPHGDIKSPQKLGINTFIIESAYKTIEKNTKILPLIQLDRKNRTLAEAAIYGLIQKRWFDNPSATIAINTHFGGDPIMLGYAGLGPALFGFLNWTMNNAKIDGVEKLLFLSRDGKILYQMAQSLYPKKDGWPEIEYAMSSRRAARVASMKNIGDISNLIDSSLAQSTLKELFKNKLGIDITQSDLELDKNNEFKTIHDKVGPINREKIRSLAFRLADKILKNANSERELLIEHYKTLGVGEKRVGIVDIGYASTMQAAMSDIMEDKTINGYYYVTFDTSINVIHKTGLIRGYVAELAKRTVHQDIICTNGFLFETLFCSSDSSFIKFSHNPQTGNVRTILNVNENDSIRRRIVENVHSGVLLFANDLNKYFHKHLKYLSINSTSAAKILTDLIKSPSGKDAEIFEGCIFDDSFAGSQPRYIVPPRELIKKNPDIVKSSIWVAASSVFSRRPDIFNIVSTPPQLKKKNIEATQNENTSQPKTITDSNANQSYPILERNIIKLMCNERKIKKYKKDRTVFFNDSNNKLIQFYWNSIGSKL